MPIISVLVAFLVFLCNSTVPDGVLPENANAVAQFNASGFQAPHAAVGRTRLLSRFGVPTAAWGTLVRVEPGGDAPSTQPYGLRKFQCHCTAIAAARGPLSATISLKGHWGLPPRNHARSLQCGGPWLGSPPRGSLSKRRVIWADISSPFNWGQCPVVDAQPQALAATYDSAFELERLTATLGAV